MAERIPVAKKKIKKSGGGFHEIGDPVPEALAWRNIKAWFSTNHLGWPDEASVAPTVVSAPPAEPEMVEPVDTEANVEPVDPDAEGTRYACDQCDRDFSTEAGLKRHVSRTHAE